MLQAGRSRLRFPMRSLNFFFSLPNPSSRTMALKLTQYLAEISIITSFCGGGGAWPTRKADIITAICEPIF
jgi:hypothetical protein